MDLTWDVSCDVLLDMLVLAFLVVSTPDLSPGTFFPAVSRVVVHYFDNFQLLIFVVDNPSKWPSS
jgi:hypothetical protein